MKAAIYLGKESVEVRELPEPICGDDDVVIENICSSICGTDVAVFTHGPNTGHRITVGGEFGHETVSRVVEVGRNVTRFSVGERVYPYPLLAKDDTSRAGTIGLASAIALKHFGVDAVMLCDRSDFRLGIAEQLGFIVCNTAREDFIVRATEFFGTAPSLTGPAPDIDCWIDAAGAEEILDDFMAHGKIMSRFVAVAVNKKPRQIDLLHMTYAQKSIIGSGGYCPEDVRDVMDIMASGRWDIASIVTHEFGIEDIEEAIRAAADPEHALNVVIRW